MQQKNSAQNQIQMDEVPDGENVVVLEHGSVAAQKIAKAMASPTAGELFNVLSDGPLTATALAERTGFPLTTVKYHLDNLLDADLIEVVSTRWSEKGREMKIYGVKDQVVVLAPKKRANVRGIAERYGVLAGVVAIGSAMVLAATNILKQYVPMPAADIARARTAVMPPSTPEVAPLVPSDVIHGVVVETVNNSDIVAYMTKEAQFMTMTVDSSAEAGAGVMDSFVTLDLLNAIQQGVLIFFIAAVVILAGMFVFEMYRIRKAQN